MDDIRDWILVCGSVLLASVLAHAAWLAWRSRRTNLRLEIDSSAHEEIDELELLRAELPTGGARVVLPEHESESSRQTDLDLDQQVPVLMDSVAEAGEAEKVPVMEQARVASAGEAAPKRSREASREERSPQSAVDSTAGTVDPEWGDFEEVVVINVLARTNGFVGTDIVELAGKHGLKFGDMNIFHRYSPGKHGLDGIRFSMASAVEPGTFDLGALHEYTTPGVSLFMRLPGPEGPMSAFEEMLRVARDIAERLDGELRDEQRSVMTPQTIEHCRQRIHEFARKRLMHRA
jgi:cell division protein ZipA